MKIISRDNSLLRRARAVRDGKITESIFVEGLRLCEEALRSGLKIEAVVYSEELARKDRATSVIQRLERVAAKSVSVNERLLKSISYTSTPQGIIVLATRPVASKKQFQARQPGTPLLVVLHKVNNPVNVGAIIRTAEGAGSTGVITTQGTADPFAAKALRGAMGSTFRLPMYTNANYRQVIEWLRKQNIQIACADVNAKTLYTEIDWKQPKALIVGAESVGLSEAEVAAADECVRIPMQGSIESLNVGVAAAILLYEAHRQRRAP